MKKASAGAMVASEVAKTKGGQKIIDSTASSVGNTMQTANRVQSVLGWTITALILAGGGFLIWRLVIKPAIDKAESSGEQRADVKEGELLLKEYDRLGLKVDPLKNYKGIADGISNALNGGTENEDAVYAQVRLISNDAEWEALKIAWGGVDGTRPVSGVFTSTNYTLVGALVTLLNTSERDIINQIFASKNMKTRI
jgi:hypothetical protein